VDAYRGRKIVVLQNLGDHIKACRHRAIEANNRAAQTLDPILSAEFTELANQWTHLASSYEHAESLERFLLDTQKAKDALEPQAPKEPK
jgi:hypothetical protein